MQHFDSIIFDLDGTLWDASDTCADAWNIALNNLGINDRKVTADEIQKVTGMPFEECVRALFTDFPQGRIEQLADEIDVQERTALMINGGQLYDGVVAGIELLAQHYKLFIVSNCQSWYLQLFLDQHEMRSKFLAISCHGGSGIGKTDMISKICDSHQLRSPIYIGDTKGDQIASVEAGVAFGFASYGFGESDAPDYTFSSFTQLTQWFNRGKSA